MALLFRTFAKDAAAKFFANIQRAADEARAIKLLRQQEEKITAAKAAAEDEARAIKLLRQQEEKMTAAGSKQAC